MIACYILYSSKIDSYYIGITQESIESRVERHNLSLYGSTYTSKVNDWELYYFIECNSIAQAIKIEKHIKKMKSKKYIENLKKYIEITIKLIDKYKNP